MVSFDTGTRTHVHVYFKSERQTSSTTVPSTRTTTKEVSNKYTKVYQIVNKKRISL